MRRQLSYAFTASSSKPPGYLAEAPNYYVITLPGCFQRTAQIRDSLLCRGIPYRIIYGTDGLAAGALTGIPFDPKLAKSPGIVGCAWSHFKAASEILKSGKPGFIIEDDAILIADRAMIEEAVAELPKDFDIAFLHTSSWEQFKPETSGHTDSFYRVEQLSHGTQFYYLSVKGAEKMIKEILPISDHVDMWYRTRKSWNKYQHKTGFAVHDYDNNSVRTDHKIPRVIHQIWVGNRPIPESFQKYTQTWALLNSYQGFRTTLWTDRLLEQEFPAEWRAVVGKSPAIISDFMRICILQRYGGLYVDMDFECLRPIHALLNGNELVWGEELPGVTSTGFIAAVADHSVMKVFKEIAEERIEVGIPLPECSGPPAFRAALSKVFPAWDQEKKPSNRTITLPPIKAARVPAVILYPYYMGQVWAREKHPQAYAVHHWAGSWLRK